MRWSKVGLVLPAPPPVSWARSHAALPAVEELDGDGARILFSTRDAEGRSHIARAHLILDGEARARIFEEPVLRPGPLGSYEDSGVTMSCVVAHGGWRFLYYTGWSLGRTVPFYLFAGCAVSKDGGPYERVSPAPLLERSSVDPYLTASPWVLVEDGLWRMWYVAGATWEETPSGPRHRYHIRYAESGDGLAWERTGRVCIDFRDEAEYAIARPCVVRDGDRYRMWFSARGDIYRLGYATSDDGLTWDRDDAQAGLEARPGEWDEEQAYPVVFDRGRRRFMLYNGNGYGETGIGLAVAE